jgi:N-methylhydantoinase A
VSDLRETFVRTTVTPLVAARLDDIRMRIDELKARAEAWFGAEAVGQADRIIDIVLDARFVGQNFELPIALGSADPLPCAEDIRQMFFAEHDRAYGFHNPADPVEIVNFRLIAVGRLRRPAARPGEHQRGPTPRASEARPVWFLPEQAEQTPIYHRAALRLGDAIDGPAVIEQLDSTTLLFPGDRAVVDPYLNLAVELAP